jgi:hypothetical protein
MPPKSKKRGFGAKKAEKKPDPEPLSEEEVDPAVDDAEVGGSSAEDDGQASPNGGRAADTNGVVAEDVEEDEPAPKRKKGRISTGGKRERIIVKKARGRPSKAANKKAAKPGPASKKAKPEKKAESAGEESDSDAEYEVCGRCGAVCWWSP